MGTKIPVTIQVDSEVKAIGDTLIKLAQDIKAKATLAQDFGDLAANLAPALGDIGSLSADLKSNPDNRKYLAGALDSVVEVFLA